MRQVYRGDIFRVAEFAVGDRVIVYGESAGIVELVNWSSSVGVYVYRVRLHGDKRFWYVGESLEALE